MRIAVDLRLSTDEEEYQAFIVELCMQLALRYSEDQFLLATNDGLLTERLGSHSNVNVSVTSRTAEKFSFLQWWSDWRLSRNLSRFKPDVYIRAGDNCNRFISIPQILVWRHSLPGNSPGKLRKMQERTAKATVVVTTSDVVEHELQRQLQVAPGKIINIGLAAKDIYQPVSWQKKESIKEQYAAGCEYLVVTGGFQAAANLINLLKAFTIFKRRQRTNMKLLLASGYKPRQNDVLDSLDSYKLKHEVRVLHDLAESELADIVAGAYALVSMGVDDASAMAAISALQSEVPVLVAATGHMREVTGNAGLYVDPASPMDIAEQLKTIFKDEALRDSLIQAGRSHVAGFSWQTTTKRMMQAIEQAISN